MAKQFRNLHIYLSLFFLPIALMYAITGVLYISGFNQDSGATKHSYTLTQNIEQGKEIEALVQYLKDNHLSLPSDLTPKTGKGGTLSIGGTHYSASIVKNSDSTYTITTLKRSFIGDMIMLHKAKAKWYFNVLAIGFGITLILLYLSGLMITLFNSKKNRKIQYATILAGCVVSFIIGSLSVL
ncbi:PepSY-associated TM helix domain-containing protein [uncultured Helicobacter sp.]|uniref:PepSY-associated TM helix domain-containing protein n=1 Tax=uncultured Helicobacter sp. TaxID=175537 RepID=UPI00261C1028|nr:PepSY-associated TM helix domain-containing protein [uncultured Helicobacter sp.]